MRKIIGLIGLLSMVFIIGCATGDSGTTDNTKTNDDAKIGSVCIWDKAAVKAEPNKDGKYLTSISLGEKVKFLDEKKIDETDKNREYVKVELSDGTIGWASGALIITNAYTAAVIEDAKIYQRPDLLTVTENQFEIMDMVAVTSEKDDWLEVVGKELKKKGWIQKNKVTNAEEDVAVCLLAQKRIVKNGKIQVELIEDFIGEVPYKNSVFVSHLNSFISGDQSEEITEETVKEQPEREKDTPKENSAKIETDSVKEAPKAKKGKSKGNN